MTVYEDILDQALAAERGLKIRFVTQAEAASFRFRLYRTRTRARKTYGQTPWDTLFLTIHEEEGDEPWVLCLEKTNAIQLNIEDM